MAGFSKEIGKPSSATFLWYCLLCYTELNLDNIVFFFVNTVYHFE